MGKRSGCRVDPLGRYDTPAAAVAPLIRHLPPGLRYWEPCAGALALVRTLEGHATCVVATDLAPRAEGVFRMPGDAVSAADLDGTGIEAIITNPPWPLAGRAGDPALRLIACWMRLRPTWALLPADFMHNVYFGRVSGHCAKIVSVGRVSWSGNGVGGKDNAAWYQFLPMHYGQTAFFGRWAA